MQTLAAAATRPSTVCSSSAPSTVASPGALCIRKIQRTFRGSLKSSKIKDIVAVLAPNSSLPVEAAINTER